MEFVKKELNFTANQARSIAHESRTTCNYDFEIEALYDKVKAKILAASESGSYGEFVGGLHCSDPIEEWVLMEVVDRLKSEGFKVHENWYRKSYDRYVMNLDINWAK